jgi:hypothetical protein
MAEGTFNEAVKAKPVVFAPFARSGRVAPIMSRVVQRLAEEAGHIGVAKLDLEENAALVEEYKNDMDPLSDTLCFEFPGLALFREGKLITTFRPIINMPTEKLNEEAVERQLRSFLDHLNARSTG